MLKYTYRRSCSAPVIQRQSSGAESSEHEQHASVRETLSNNRVQPKMRIGAPDDQYEQEADRVASSVVEGMDAPGSVTAGGESIQRQMCIAPDESEMESAPATDQDFDEEMSGLSVQRKCTDCEKEEELQKKPESSVGGGGSYASADISAQVRSSRGQGSPLPAQTANTFGQKMNADFSQVRIHTDGKAAQLNKQLNSHAFTYGRDIYFNSGKFNPGTVDGQFLLAHELTHTLQQSRNTLRKLSVTGVGSLVKGACGARERKWKFELGSPAPSDGYMVQQVDSYEEVKDCPQTARCLAKPTHTFWEAWRFNKGDTLFAQFSRFGFSDMNRRGSRNGKSGYDVATGEIKFFSRTTTGDLGDLRTAPASPNGGWGPGAEPRSGILPSTKTQPSWWSSSPVEGPAHRSSYSAWRCCPDGTNFNVIRATP